MPTGLENLKIYQLAKELELEIHQATKKFPIEERWRSVDQLNRSAAAVSNNIAEAYHKLSVIQREHILRNIAIGEAEETKRNIERCSMKTFISKTTADDIANRYTSLIKGVYGYIRFLKNQSTN
ncbi:MAG: four helix bundle protein [Candidatus Brennerbacteria bacterium]|nr:four helix bundle protein [Candidatus Brennerbacteria bacterium]